VLGGYSVYRERADAAALWPCCMASISRNSNRVCQRDRSSEKEFIILGSDIERTSGERFRRETWILPVFRLRKTNLMSNFYPGNGGFRVFSQLYVAFVLLSSFVCFLGLRLCQHFGPRRLEAPQRLLSREEPARSSEQASSQCFD